MSAETSGDITRIQDEDLLRKMWQDTEDFGKKKEIRSHMYKLREDRLRNFYCANEPGSDMHKAQSSPGLNEKSTKDGNTLTHADSLGDHSFLSLKSKEIRDSESPTRDVAYRVHGKSFVNPNWDIMTKSETSADGKTHSTHQIASTSGKEQIKGGVADYAAKCEQSSSVFADGDDNNYTKSATAASKSVLQQTATAKDSNGETRSLSSSASSSSRVMTQKQSTTYSNTEMQPTPSDFDISTSSAVTRKTYTTNIPAEFKSHPHYVEGKTKVTTETRVMPDGTKVTTTRYETRGGGVTSSEQYNTTKQQQFSSTSASKTAEQQNINESKHQMSSGTTTPQSGSTVITMKVYKLPDDNRNQDATEYISKATSSSTEVLQNRQIVDSKYTDIIHSRDAPNDDVKVIRAIQEHEYIPRNTKPNIGQRPTEPGSKTSVTEKETLTTGTKTTRVHSSQNGDDYILGTEFQPYQKEPKYDHNQTYTTTTTTSHINDMNERNRTQKDTQVHTEYIPAEQEPLIILTKDTWDEREVRKNTQDTKVPVDRDIPKKPISVEVSEIITSNQSKPEPVYEIKPSTNEYIIQTVPKTTDDIDNLSRTDTYPKPQNITTREVVSETHTKEQQTTYKTDYTSKRISVDISPTHDAFARSLRAVSPDHDQKRGSPVPSNASFRRSATPDKHTVENKFHVAKEKPVVKKARSPIEAEKVPRRISPSKHEREPTDRKVEQIHNKDKPRDEAVDFYNIHRHQKNTHTVTTVNQPAYSIKSAHVPGEQVPKDSFVKHPKDVTDRRPNSLNITTTITTKKTKKITERSPTSPLTPTKDKPQDKPLKRRDTYEERCREILGIDKTTQIQPGKPKRPNENVRQSPTKEKPGDIVKTTTSSKTSTTISKTDHINQKDIQEYPSQTRRSPEKAPLRKPVDSQQPERAGHSSSFPTQTSQLLAEEFYRRPQDEKQPSSTHKYAELSEYPSHIRDSPEKSLTPGQMSPVKPQPSSRGSPPKIRDSPETSRVVKQPSPTKPDQKRTPDSNRQQSPEKSKHPSPPRSRPEVSEYPAQHKRTEEELYILKQKSPIKDKPETQTYPTRQSPEKKPVTKETYTTKGQVKTEIHTSEKLPRQTSPIKGKQELQENLSVPDRKASPSKNKPLENSRLPTEKSPPKQTSPSKEKPLLYHTTNKQPQEPRKSTGTEKPLPTNNKHQRMPLPTVPQDHPTCEIITDYPEYTTVPKDEHGRETLVDFYIEQTQLKNIRLEGTNTDQIYDNENNIYGPKGNQPSDQPRYNDNQTGDIHETTTKKQILQGDVSLDSEPDAQRDKPEHYSKENFPTNYVTTEIINVDHSLRTDNIFNQQPIGDKPEPKPTNKFSKPQDYPYQTIEKPSKPLVSAKDVPTPSRRSPEKPTNKATPVPEEIINIMQELKSQTYPQVKETFDALGESRTNYTIEEMQSHDFYKSQTEIVTDTINSGTRKEYDSSTVTRRPKEKPQSALPMTAGGEVKIPEREGIIIDEIPRLDSTEKPKAKTYPSQCRMSPEKYPSEESTPVEVENSMIPKRVGKTTSIDKPQTEVGKPIRPIVGVPNNDDLYETQNFKHLTPTKNKPKYSEPTETIDLKTKQPKIQEYPSQIRSSPEKSQSTSRIQTPKDSTSKPIDRAPLKTTTTKKEPVKTIVTIETSKGEQRPKPLTPSNKDTPAKQKPPSNISSKIDSQIVKKTIQVKRKEPYFDSPYDKPEGIYPVEETLLEKRISQLENAPNINEPVCTKRFINNLCREEELQRSRISNLHGSHQTVKKDSPEKTINTEFIKNEQDDVEDSFVDYQKPGNKIIPETKEQKGVLAKPLKESREHDHQYEETSPYNKHPHDKNQPKTIVSKEPKWGEKVPVSKDINVTEPLQIKPLKKQGTPSDKVYAVSEHRTIVTTTMKPKHSFPSKNESERTSQLPQKLDHSIVRKSDIKTITTTRTTTEQSAPLGRPKENFETVTNKKTTPSKRFSQPTDSTHIYTKVISEKTVSKPKQSTLPKPSKPDEPLKVTKIAHKVEDTIKTKDSNVSTLVMQIKPAQKTTKSIKKVPVGAKLPNETQKHSPKVEEIKNVYYSKQTDITRKVPDKATIPRNAPNIKEQPSPSKRYRITATVQVSPRAPSIPKQKSPSAPGRQLVPDKDVHSSEDEETFTDVVDESSENIVTHKSVVTNNDFDNNSDVVITLQRSTSSRESTPNRICPQPITDQDDYGTLRYPDEISEPNEYTRKPFYIHGPKSDSPQRVDRVDETDESLLTVTQKVNKFINEAEKLTKTEQAATDSFKQHGVILKPNDSDNLQKTDYLKNDPIPKRPKSPRCQNYPRDIADESYATVSERVSQFTKTTETISSSPQTNQDVISPKVKKPEQDINRTVVQEVIEPTKPVTLNSPKKPAVSPSCPVIDTEEQTYTRISSTTLSTDGKPKPVQRNEIKQIYQPNNTFKPTQKEEEPKHILSSAGRLRSTETIRKAKELFEHQAKHVDVVETKKEEWTIKKPTYPKDDNKKNIVTQRFDKEPGYMKPIDKSPKLHEHHTTQHPYNEKLQPESLHTKDEAPGYIKPLDKCPKRHHPSQQLDNEKLQHTRHQAQPLKPEEIPRHAKPSDRSVKPQDHYATQHDDNKYQPNIPQTTTHEHREKPGYMKPLDRNQKPQDEQPQYTDDENLQSHSLHTKTSKHEVHSYMKQLDRITQPHDYYSTQQPYDNRCQPETQAKLYAPGYMKSLDRSIRPHDHHSTQHTDGQKLQPDGLLAPSPNPAEATHQTKSHEPKDEPGYMKPLDRSLRPHDYHITQQLDEERLHFHEHLTKSPKPEEVPHYMKPIDRSSKPHDHHETQPHDDHVLQPEGIHIKYIETEEVPGYMKPLDRNIRPHDHHSTQHPDGRKFQPDGLLTQSPKPEEDTLQTKSRELKYESGYMKPLDRSPRPHDYHITQHPDEERLHPHEHHTKSLKHEEVPGYMKPLDRSPKPHDYHQTQPYDDHVLQPEGLHIEYTETEVVPGYMKPLDRAPRPQDYYSTQHTDSQIVQSDMVQIQSPVPEIVPGYMKPLDRSQRLHDHQPSHHLDDKPQPDKPQTEVRAEEVPGYMKPLDRSIKPHDYHPIEHPYDEKLQPDELQPKTSVHQEMPGYMKPLDRSSKPHFYDDNLQPNRPPSESLEPSIENLPHYMWPLNRGSREESVEHERSPSRSSVHTTDSQNKKLSRGSTPDRHLPGYMKPLDRQASPSKPTKFGVTLKSTTTTKMHSPSQKPTPSFDVNDLLSKSDFNNIFDVEVLEILLEKATNYEQRRKIRAQIRIVKQDYTDSVQTSRHEIIKTQRKGNEYNKIKDSEEINKKQIHSKNTEHINQKTEYQTSYQTEEHVLSAQRSKQTTATTTLLGQQEKIVRKPLTSTQNETSFKPSNRSIPIKGNENDKPSWVGQRNLKKVSENPHAVSTTTTTTTKRIISKGSLPKDNEPTSVITSSYGVGPTDENGSPLFGLRALRVQNQTESTKVQGTVIQSHYYSKNGQEPIGEVRVTKYSSDPRDLEGHNVEDKEGVLSVTTIQKIGPKGIPKKKINDQQTADSSDEHFEELVKKTTNTQVVRRDSVKEMSKKFIDNAVETSKTDKQSSYPKAGLILRTSSFKDTSKQEAKKQTSPGHQDNVRTVTVTKTVTSSEGGRTNTFLTNKTRVQGVQDTITRMKNADEDFEIGDSPEDAEARTLLNKFIGSQVILSGMESRTSSVPSSATNFKQTTTTTTTTSMGSEKPTVVTRTFTHPISEEDLNTIWDEQTLKLLLERSTEFEERQIIRSRLHNIMAEQEEVETSKATFTEGPITTNTVTTKVTSQQVSKKPLSPFEKFQQLDRQNSLTSPGTPRTPTGSGPLFKFTDPELSRQASTVKERLLQWCQMKTKEYENVQLDNFSSSWSDGLAFCALIHHFLPDAFDYHALTSKDRRHNFDLAFRIADEKANIVPLLDVEDMVATRKPDWKCVFTYVQTIYARFKHED